jgi:porphobilinogen synthase
MRRKRKNQLIRDLVSETVVTPEKLIMPIFIDENLSQKQPINSMPDYFKYPLGEELIKHVEEAKNVGISAFILFGIPKTKDSYASSAFSENGVIQKAIRMLRETFGNKLILVADECMDEYTDHGHCGLIREVNGNIDVVNDESLEIHSRIALSQAEAGADIIAPSSMMDGVVKAIREKLDEEGYKNVMIMAYSAKYASMLYSPFREAAFSAPKFGDRKGYQMDPRNALEAIKEVELDIEEGADIVMVKPAILYLDVIRIVKDNFPEYPLAAYNVSGEYSMVKQLARTTGINEFALIWEVLHSIFRAGANMVITYHAFEYAKRFNNNEY